LSYARIAEDGCASDVYVIGTGDGLECIGCELSATGRYYTEDGPGAMLIHLALHRELGDAVPQRAFDRLELERQGVAPRTAMGIVSQAVGQLVETRLFDKGRVRTVEVRRPVDGVL
jgi:hypothetical protein